MSGIIPARSGGLPLPGLPITIRPAIPGDLAFIDGLQKLHTQMVGWMPMKQLEEKIRRGACAYCGRG